MKNERSRTSISTTARELKTNPSPKLLVLNRVPMLIAILAALVIYWSLLFSATNPGRRQTNSFRIQERDILICELLLRLFALSQEMIDKHLFHEPNTKKTRIAVRLKLLVDHQYIKRVRVNGVGTVYLLLPKGRDLIAQTRNVHSNTLGYDPKLTEDSITHWNHFLPVNTMHLLIMKAGECLNSQYILDKSDLPTEIRAVAKQFVQRGWSRRRVFDKVNYVLFLLQSQSIEDPATWLASAIEENAPKPKGFPKAFRSPLITLDNQQGYQILNVLRDIDLSRLKAQDRLKVQYTPLNGNGLREGQIEADLEVTVGFNDPDKPNLSRSYTMMIEYDSGSRPLERSTVADSDRDDNSFATQMIKRVSMLNSKTYRKKRGRNLDRICVIVNGLESAVNNRLRVIERVGGKHKFVLASMDTLKSLKSPHQVLTAPVFSMCAVPAELFVPLIGSSSLKRLLQKIRRTTKSEAEAEKLRNEIFEVAWEELYFSIYADFDQDQMQQFTKELRKGDQAAKKWLHKLYTQRKGKTFYQTLAIYADIEAERHMEEMK